VPELAVVVAADNGGQFLVDTSAWLDALQPRVGREDVRERVRRLVADDRVVVIGAVRTEVLRGTRDEAEYVRLSAMLDALTRVETEERDWDDAARLGFMLRRAGTTVGLADLVLAAVAIRHGLTALHGNADLDRVARHSRLVVESYA
jgi:predicted nucleic acid-binding protein